MKTQIALFVCLALLSVTPAHAENKIYTEAVDRGYGIYVLKWPNPHGGEVFYYVDVNAELCFVAHFYRESETLLEIDCSKLAKRKEWQKIITWVSPSSSN